MNTITKRYLNKLMEKEDISRKDVIAELNKKTRKASIANYFLSSSGPKNPFTSWFFGHSVALPNEEFKDIKGKPLFPLIQINCSELPYVPKQLKGIALIVVYVIPTTIPSYEKPYTKQIEPGKYIGLNWALREYKSLSGLKPLENIVMPQFNVNLWAKSAQIKWKLVNNELPSWGGAWQEIRSDVMEKINNDDELDDIFWKYSHSYETKVGGYLYEVQHYPDHSLKDGSEFVFQIGSNEKIDFNIIDSGVMGFFKNRRGFWECNTQFY